MVTCLLLPIIFAVTTYSVHTGNTTLVVGVLSEEYIAICHLVCFEPHTPFPLLIPATVAGGGCSRGGVGELRVSEFWHEVYRTRRFW